MYFLTFNQNGIKYPLNLYGKLDYLKSIIIENHNRALSYCEQGNWSLLNQHPLVQFIINMDVEFTWDDEYLFNYIRAKYLSVSSLCNFTSLRNSGDNHIRSLFPEKNHDVLITVPFGEPPNSQEYYFEEAYQNLIPLRTIFTTDLKQRWSVSDLTNNNASTELGKQNNYTIVQLDPYALIIGYVRYVKDRVDNQKLVGLTASSYLTKYPLVNFYNQHNQMVVVNYNLDGIEGMEFDHPKWSMVPYKRWLSDYSLFIKNTMFKLNPETIYQYFNQNLQLNISNEITDSFYPKVGLSCEFLQLGWVYCFNSMRLAYAYAEYCESVSKPDNLFRVNMKKFLRNNVNTIANKIKEPVWKTLFIRMFNDLKDIID